MALKNRDLLNTHTRDASRVLRSFKVVDSVMIAVEPIKIQFPRSHASGHLGSVSSTVKAVGCYAIITADKHYAVDMTDAIINFTPQAITILKIEDVEYFELSWEAGDIICPDLNVVQSPPLVYHIYNNFVSYGKGAWFFDIEDKARLFDTSAKIAKMHLRTNRSILEMMASVCCRDAKSVRDHLRHTAKNLEELRDFSRLRIIPLKSVGLGAMDTSSALSGSYFRQAMTSVLVNRNEELNALEAVYLS